MWEQDGMAMEWHRSGMGEYSQSRSYVTHTEWSMGGATQCNFYVDDHMES